MHASKKKKKKLVHTEGRVGEWYELQPMIEWGSNQIIQDSHGTEILHKVVLGLLL